MATHYWPGQLITSLPFVEVWDSSDWDHLPISTSPPAPPGDAGEVGYDQNRPGRATSTFSYTQVDGGNPTIFHLVGEGRDVELLLTAAGSQGVAMQVFDFSLTSATGLNGVPAWFKYVTANYLGEYPKSVGVRAFLVSGRDYYLNAASYSGRETVGTPGQPDYVSGNGQLLTLTARYAPVTLNDHRDDAIDVVIAASGQTYKSPTVFNVGYTRAVNATDDPTGTTADATAWWRYVAASDTTFTATSYIGPEGFNNAVLTAWRMSGAGAMTPLVEDQGNPGQITGSADAGETIYFQVGVYIGAYVNAGQTYELWVTGGKTVKQNPPKAPDPDRTPPDDPPWDSDVDPPPDKFTPDAIAPADKPTDTGSSSLLDLVRAFSSAVRRAVRITGPDSIEMVNPLVPLPTGMVASDARDMYATTMRSAAAETTVLSVRAGDVKVEASAGIVSGDVRVVRSGWRIPDRLPVYGLPAAPVKRITYTYSPTGFTASVDFHFAAVPIEARRI